MSKSFDELMNEVRYAERLTQRTARLYRRVHTASTCLTVLGGSAALANLASSTPAWVGVTGAFVLAVFGAINLAVRPAEKAASNEADARRYAKLRTAARRDNVEAFERAINEARESDAPEIETLRDVAYNDVVCEVGRADQAVTLTRRQKLLALVA